MDLAEVAITNDAGTALGNIALSATNTTVYVFDTDATEIGTATAAAITDFTSMTVVAAFLNTGDGVTASDTEDKVDYFIINDGGTGNAYVYKFVDNGDGTTDVQAADITDCYRRCGRRSGSRSGRHRQRVGRRLGRRGLAVEFITKAPTGCPF